MRLLSVHRKKGFTLIEVVAVLLILGVLAAVAVARSVDSQAELTSQVDVIKSHLRYAQSRAMATEEVWGVTSTGATYYLFRDNDENQKVTFPGEDADVVTLSDKNITFMEKVKVTFDETGRPSRGGTLMTASDNLTIKDKNGQKKIITIVAYTGYIS